MREKIISILKDGKVDSDVLVKGWVRTKRDSKNVMFLELNDGSSISNIQVVLTSDHENYNNLVKINTGSSVAVKGKLVESLGKNQRVEIVADNIEIYGLADSEDYPLQKKRHSFEYLREISHLRARTNTFGAVFRVRNALADSIHQYFQNKNFLYVNTPIITSSDCEGAGEMFTVTTLGCGDCNDATKNQADSEHKNDFFGTKTALTVSGQLEGELLALALGDVYTFGPTFRAENSNTSRHLSEFWMVEPEMAFADLNDDIELADDFIKTIIKETLRKCPEDMEFFDSRISKGKIEALNSVASVKSEIVDYTDAISILQKCGKTFDYKVEWGIDLQSEHERFLGEEYFKKPTFVINYPKDIKPFYMKINDDGKTVAAMDLLVPGIGEIIGGSEREYRYDVMLERMIQAGLSPVEYSWYLDTRKYGTAPHAGFGLGFERMVQYITGMQNIRDVIPFPRVPGNVF